MGKLALTSLAVAVLVLTGCSQKSPEVDMTKGTSDTKGTTDGGIVTGKQIGRAHV